MNFTVRGVELELDLACQRHGSKHFVGIRRDVAQVVPVQNGSAGQLRIVEPGRERHIRRIVEREIGIRLDANPSAGVAAFAQFVIHQPRVTPHGNPLARGVEIRLGRDCILEIAQVVPDVGQQLDERDAEVGKDLEIALSGSSSEGPASSRFSARPKMR